MAQSYETLENGNIYFLYRPKVEHETVNSEQDIQRLHVVLSPHGQQRYRLLTIGRNQLPDLAQKQPRDWGFVESVTDDAKSMEQGLREEHYSTKTRGDRTQPAARPVGEGVYSLVRRERSTFLSYVLELPEPTGEAQDALQIEPEASYVLSIKNPDKPSPEGAGFHRADRKAEFPQSLQEQFRDRRFVPADPSDFLNYEGAEFVLVGASDSVPASLAAKASEETEATAEILNDLRMRKSRHPIEPLLTGEWN